MVFPDKMTGLLLVIGIILLLLGRRAYLISIGILGFLGGLYIFATFLGTVHDWRSILFALLTGTIGSLLAYALHKAAWIFGGFFGGGVLLYYLRDSTGLMGSVSPVLLFVVGGIVGAIFLSLLLDQALILISCLTGSALITYQSGRHGTQALLLFVGLFILGFIVQGRSLRGDHRRKYAG
jgi:hypothetical protein